MFKYSAFVEPDFTIIADNFNRWVCVISGAILLVSGRIAPDMTSGSSALIRATIE